MNFMDTIEEKEQLIEWFKEGYKPKDHWMVGTEHENLLIPFLKEEKIYTIILFW